jgi:hypothetical protein
VRIQNEQETECCVVSRLEKNYKSPVCSEQPDGVRKLTEEKKYTEKEAHRKFAVDLFNLVWSLMDKKDRTKEEDDKMIYAAHASRFHWGEIGTPLEFERGEWQVSRVYSVLNRPQQALHHAKRCLEICQSNNIGDFDIAFAYEAMARAHAIAGKKAECEKYAQLAKEAGEQIKKKEDRNYFFNELKTIVV